MDQTGKILLVDDEELNLKFLETLLTRMGHEVHLAGNGQEAVDMVKELEPDLIFMDVFMPGMDGLEATKIIKGNQNTLTIPIVVISSMSEVEYRVRALEAGADDFLSKPVDPTELRARVRSLLKVKEYNDYQKEHQKWLEREVAKRTMQLQQASEKIRMVSLETIFRLSQAAEYKDEDTGAHIVRMGYYAAAIARQMRLNRKDVEAILYAAPMHDIGKIGIPDRILLKPGSLDSDEWQIMKQHTTIGAKLLTGSDFEITRMAEVIALTHHEKWNGDGYPKGLKGEQIPVVGRISAIADVFDALTTRRPYKAPFTLEKSLDIITGMTGEHFDPEVVAAFFEIRDEILEIRNNDSLSSHRPMKVIKMPS